MGGKTKQTQRTKNNTKPSSSFRSAELLGTEVPTFVGFSAHAELGMVPFAPGLATSEQLADAFDGKISPQFQMVLRKMSKKDPITKKKALLELIDLVNRADMHELKVILPLWPKYYQTLANDTEHNLRELAQTVLQLFVTKCKRAVAPYIKQLVPVWLTSQFDTFAPASSIATKVFQDTFPSNTNKVREVCVHCQSEIMEYTRRNIIFHSAATLSSGTSLLPAEAEQKYQRVLLGSLRALSFFVAHTTNAENRSQIQENFQQIFAHPKFWSIAKHKLTGIKSAWFELINNILQQGDLVQQMDPYKAQLIGICFQNIDDADPLVAPQIWDAIVQLQSIYVDWNTYINVNKSLLPKLFSLLKNGFNRNATAVSPDLLPFFCMFLKAKIPDVEKVHFCHNFFDNLNYAIINLEKQHISKSDCIAIIKGYFECLRYLIQKININDIGWGDMESLQTLTFRLLDEHVLETIAALLNNNNWCVKYFFMHSSALVAFWTERQSCNEATELYTKMLAHFWTRLFTIISDGIDKRHEVNANFLDHTFELLKHLHLASPSFDDQRVKFAEVTAVTENNYSNESSETSETSSKTECRQVKGGPKAELKEILVKLVRIGIRNINENADSRDIGYLHRLLTFFGDRDIYTCLGGSTDINASLNVILKGIQLLEKRSGEEGDVDEVSYELLVDIIFDILQFMEKKEDMLDYIEQNLVKIPILRVQTMVLQRLLSYPLCIEPKVRFILAKPEANIIMINIARKVLTDFSKDKLNLMHKCFFETDSGEILITPQTVDSIVTILSEPLVNPNLVDVLDSCGSFIAQIMPVVCNIGNSSSEVRNDVFLKLFRLSVTHKISESLSEDTLWELTTCWQDALSSGDIELNAALSKACAAIVEECLQHDELTIKFIDDMAEVMAKLVMCSAENIDDNDDRHELINTTIEVLYNLHNNKSDIRKAACFYTYVEAMKGVVSPCGHLNDLTAECPELKPIFARHYLNLTTTYKLSIKSLTPNNIDMNRETVNDNDEITEDYCDSDQLLQHHPVKMMDGVMDCVYVSSIADIAIEANLSSMSPNVELLAIALSEKLKMYMENAGDILLQVKQDIQARAEDETDPNWCRALKYFAHIQYYSQFEENATILLFEHISEFFLENCKLKAYVNYLQYVLTDLQPNSFTLKSPVMRMEPETLWTKAAIFRCLIRNNFVGEVNNMDDKNIIVVTLMFIMEVMENEESRKQLLLRDTEIHNIADDQILNALEFVNLLIEILERFPHELSMKNWDSIRISLSSWVLSVTNSIQHYRNPKVAIFTASVYKLYKSMSDFISSEQRKSSTAVIIKMIEEWNSLFARDVNLVLFKAFFKLCEEQEKPVANMNYYYVLLKEILPSVESLEYAIIYKYCKSSDQLSLDNVCNFLLRNLSNPSHMIRVSCNIVLKKLSHFFISDDVEAFRKGVEGDKVGQQMTQGHFLNRFEDYIGRYSLLIVKYLNEFSFKLIEIAEFEPINQNSAFSYLLLWDCMIYVCANAPIAHRSIYTTWLHENKHEDNLLHFLFRAMPEEVLKNYDNKTMGGEIFKTLTIEQIKDPHLSLQLYTCHLYTETLRKLPAIVRKWWTCCPSRQKTFIDRLTTNFISPMICNEQLRAIVDKKDKPENMKVSVQMSTREVHAVYSIEEARMEMIITLAQNYPLGTVKVDCGKQIGGKLLTRNDIMTLTLFITHQNGSICDALSLWKDNLDKKFEGIADCFICYTVLHQDTCQLPRITCKTCKNKFHGACLHQWFASSSKSTCPICRNVF